MSLFIGVPWDVQVDGQQQIQEARVGVQVPRFGLHVTDLKGGAYTVWVWPNSGRRWRPGKPGVPQSRGSRRAGHGSATEQQQSTQFMKVETCDPLCCKFYLANHFSQNTFADFCALVCVAQPWLQLTDWQMSVARRERWLILLVTLTGGKAAVWWRHTRSSLICQGGDVRAPVFRVRWRLLNTVRIFPRFFMLLTAWQLCSGNTFTFNLVYWHFLHHFLRIRQPTQQ